VRASLFCVNLLVDERVIVELKSVEHPNRMHAKQLLTYLRLMQLPVGLLISFGLPTFKEGLQRIVNNITPSDSGALGVNRLNRSVDNPSM
jgi:GxxExxY protein